MSNNAEVYEIKKEEFMKLHSMGQSAWKEVVSNVINKRRKIVETCLQSRISSKSIEF
jgi:hypothetical protein